MNVQRYIFTLQSDRGEFKLTTTASSIEGAVESVMKAENCPQGAIKGIEIEPLLPSAKEFPNGFTSWMETFFEIVQFMTMNPLNKVISERSEEQGTGGLYELAEELTDQFEDKHKGTTWYVDYFDLIEEFLNKKTQ